MIKFSIKKGASNDAPYLTFSIESTFYILAISFSTFVFLHHGHKHLSLQKALSSIEVGESFVTSESLDKLLSALDITAEDLFSTNDVKEPSELLKMINQNLAIIGDDANKLEIIYNLTKSLR